MSNMRKISADEMERLLIALAIHLLGEQGGRIEVPAVALETGGVTVEVSGDDFGMLTFSIQRN